MKQQFFVGDKVKLNQLGVEVGNRDIQDVNHDLLSSKYLLMLKHQGTAVVSKTTLLRVWLEDNAFFVTPEHLEVVERAWQKNTGKQPVDAKIEVEIKLPSCATDKAPAYQYRWDFEDSSGDIVEWRIADSVSSNEEQPEAIPPSHVALGEELAAVDATSTIVSTEQDFVNSPKHYAFFDGVEAIEIIASSMSVEAFRGYCMGNALKYRLRVGKKDKVEQEIAKADKYGELFEKHKHLCKGSNDA